MKQEELVQLLYKSFLIVKEAELEKSEVMKEMGEAVFSTRQCDYGEIRKFCETLNVNFTLIPSNVFEVVFDIRKEKNPCSLCANMRRGLLNSAAKNLGYLYQASYNARYE